MYEINNTPRRHVWKQHGAHIAQLTYWSPVLQEDAQHLDAHNTYKGIIKKIKARQTSTFSEYQL